MGVAWLEDFRAGLTRVLNIKGEGPPAYLPISDGINLTYDVTTLVSTDSESRSNVALRDLLSKNLDLVQNLNNGYTLSSSSPSTVTSTLTHKFLGYNSSLLMLTASALTCPQDCGYGRAEHLTVGTYKIDITVGMSAGQLEESKDILPCVAKVTATPEAYGYTCAGSGILAIGANKIASGINTNDLLVSASAIVQITDASYYIIGFIALSAFDPNERCYVTASAAKLSDKTVTFPLISNF